MNQNLNLPILQSEQTSLLQFINFWSAFYTYPNEDIYLLIKLPEYTESDLIRLFEWKNGMPLSALKQESLQKKVLSKIEYINQCKRSGKLNRDEFINQFSTLSFVWKIFLLHIIDPQSYPIYDQNIHRCFNFIHDREHHRISTSISEKNKQRFYFEDYLPFINNLKGIPQRKIDQAFFSFGQILNKKNGPFYLIFE